MKEFVYYNFLLNKFKEKFNQFEKIYNVLRAREKTGLEDDALSYFIDYLVNDMADLCCDKDDDIEKEGFTNILYDFIEQKEIYCYNSKENKDITYILNDVEDLFDFCYAYYLKSNLIQTFELYNDFGSETKDATLFLTYDNDFVDELYTEEDLDNIASYVTQYIEENELDEDNNIYCHFDGEMFNLYDERFVCLERAEAMENQIKFFCEENNINYEEYDY